jgi:hypothetical protein
MSAPSIDSCATAETSPIRSCARRAGPCIRRANDRFISARVGIMISPTSVRNGSVAISEISAKITRKITPIENGIGYRTSIEASTSASMCASSSPVGWPRW